MNYTYILLILLIPLAVFLLLGLFNKKIKPAISGYIGVLGLLITTIISFYTAFQYFFVIGKVDGAFPVLGQKTVWMNFTESLQIDMGFLIDPISVMMLIVVSTISLMVHIYSRGYMKGDEGYTKFFAFIITVVALKKLILAGQPVRTVYPAIPPVIRELDSRFRGNDVSVR